MSVILDFTLRLFPPRQSAPLAWGRSVSEPFRQRVLVMAVRLAAQANDPMAVMGFESGRTFSPSVRNAAGSGAVGLIQFMPQTAAALGTSTNDLAEMTAVQQLDYVEKYFLPRKGKLKTLGDVYSAVLWPAAIGKPDEYVLFRKDDVRTPKRYLQNKGLDFNKDGLVTKAEIVAKVERVLIEGLKPENAA